MSGTDCFALADEERAHPVTSVKARQLLAERRVHPKGRAAMYSVRGDSGTDHLVVIAEGFAYCSCPANRERCSHVEACEHLDLALRTEGLHGVAV